MTSERSLTWLNSRKSPRGRILAGFRSLRDLLAPTPGGTQGTATGVGGNGSKTDHLLATVWPVAGHRVTRAAVWRSSANWHG